MNKHDRYYRECVKKNKMVTATGIFQAAFVFILLLILTACTPEQAQRVNERLIEKCEDVQQFCRSLEQ